MSISLTTFGTSVFIMGILGGVLNSLVFFSLQTFRQNSCAYYLTIMSLSNIGSLGFSFSPTIMVDLTNTDLSDISLFYCKFRRCMSQACLAISMTCLCLATIDQYFATSSSICFQRLCNIKLARRLISIVVLIWLLHGIPYLLYFDHVQSSTTNKTTCTGISSNFNYYRNNIFTICIIGYLPSVTAAIFALLAYHNVRQLAYRTIPLIRRDLDKQLTVMVLIQVLFSLFTLLPYITMNAIVTNIKLTKIQLTLDITLIIYYLFFAASFYLYICASKRFRRQFIYIMLKIFINYWKRPRIDVL